jgi:flagellar basal-body rod protein FlgF
MLRSFYTAGTGMLTQRDRMEVLTNNLTNADTAGYKSDSLILGSFRDMMIERLNMPDTGGSSNIIGPLGAGAHIKRVITSFEQGNLEETGRSLDFALEGPGFFVLSTPEGDRYTRDGSFSVSSDGYLVNSSGMYVQGTNGRVYGGGDDFSVDEQGGVYLQGALTDRLKVVSFEDAEALRKDGNNMYQTGQRPLADDVTKVYQGRLEGSNVDVSGELANMLSTTRAYDTNQRVLRMIDSTLDKTVNEVGRV